MAQQFLYSWEIRSPGIITRAMLKSTASAPRIPRIPRSTEDDPARVAYIEQVEKRHRERSEGKK